MTEQLNNSPEATSEDCLSLRLILGGLIKKLGTHQERPESDGYKWRRDWRGLMPLHDRGGAISLSPSADADLGSLASFELKRLEERRAANIAAEARPQHPEV